MTTSNYSKLLDILFEFSSEHKVGVNSMEENSKAIDKAMKGIEEAVSMYDILVNRLCELNNQIANLEAQRIYDLEEIKELKARASETFYLLSFNK
jgi:hypothetical protein